MTLQAFVAEKRAAIIAELGAKIAPSQGEYNESLLKEAFSLGTPLFGASRFEPTAVLLEFVFPNPVGAPIVLTVRLTTVERIVFMPVPAWVVESIWQGEIDGSFYFESEAIHLVNKFQNMLTPEANATLFGAKLATRRE